MRSLTIIVLIIVGLISVISAFPSEIDGEVYNDNQNQYIANGKCCSFGLSSDFILINHNISFNNH